MDTRLLRSEVQGLSDDDLFWKLREPVWEDDGLGTPGQQALNLTIYFIRDVDNGGLSQALWNRGPQIVQRLLNGFIRIGASKHVELVNTALDRLFGERHPCGIDLWRRTIDEKSLEWIKEHLGPLDDQLYDETQLWPLFHRYIAEHPGEFFRDPLPPLVAE